MIVAAALWFASPAGAYRSVVSSQPNEIIRNGYFPQGQILIEKRDKITGNIVTTPGPPWVTFTISPDPYTLQPGSHLTVQDNTVYNSKYDADSSVGRILLTNVSANATGISYTIVEIVATPNYTVDPTPIYITVISGQQAVATSRDQPIVKVPAATQFGTWFLVGGFAILIMISLVWRIRSNKIRGSGGAVQ